LKYGGNMKNELADPGFLFDLNSNRSICNRFDVIREDSSTNTKTSDKKRFVYKV